MASRRTFLIRSAAGLGGCGLAAAAGGCNIAGGLFVLASGPPKIPAAFEPDSARPTVILIDDLNSVVPRSALRDRIGSVAERILLEREVFDEGAMISAASARRAALAGSAEQRLSVVDIGRMVGAEVVIWVLMTGWSLSTEPGAVSPAASAQVCLIDTLANERVWPPGERKFPLLEELPRDVRGDVPTSIAARREIEEQLATRFGRALAQMFFEHERERLSEQLRG